MVENVLFYRLILQAAVLLRRNTQCLQLILLVVTLSAGPFALRDAYADVESVLPDFYSEPDVGAFREGDATGSTETIDPLGGTLSLKYVDLSIPGDGGMDINIVRTYTSKILVSRQTSTNQAPYPGPLMPSGPSGVGWTINFGRVVKSENGEGNIDICRTDDIYTDDDIRDNAVLELPGGRQQVLNSHNWGAPQRYTFMTKELWAANCIGDGLQVFSKDGTVYTFDHHVASFDEITFTPRRNHAWYPTRIEDPNGNYLTFTYHTEQNGSHALVDQITASDGRVVDFTYVGLSTSNPRLTGITANGRTWTYEYTQIRDTSHYQLTRVVRPDGLDWEYSYYAYGQGADSYALKQVTHPYGGTVTYGYDYVDFTRRVDLAPWDYFYSVVVASKTIGGREISAATWSYAYAPGDAEDVTTITFPGGKHVYRHYGIDPVITNFVPGYDAGLWKVGLLKEKQIYAVDEWGSETLLQQENLNWSTSNVVSEENYYRPPYQDSQGNDIYDHSVFVPFLDKKNYRA